VRHVGRERRRDIAEVIAFAASHGTTIKHELSGQEPWVLVPSPFGRIVIVS
jgi:hypothetical protein